MIDFPLPPDKPKSFVLLLLLLLLLLFVLLLLIFIGVISPVTDFAPIAGMFVPITASTLAVLSFFAFAA
jgi:hypothetical protein